MPFQGTFFIPQQNKLSSKKINPLNSSEFLRKSVYLYQFVRNRVSLCVNSFISLLVSALSPDKTYKPINPKTQKTKYLNEVYYGTSSVG